MRKPAGTFIFTVMIHEGLNMRHICLRPRWMLCYCTQDRHTQKWKVSFCNYITTKDMRRVAQTNERSRNPMLRAGQTLVLLRAQISEGPRSVTITIKSEYTAHSFTRCLILYNRLDQNKYRRFIDKRTKMCITITAHGEIWDLYLSLYCYLILNALLA